MTALYQSIKRKRAEEGTNSGFTLIELLIVIVVLGILAAIVVFSLGTITGKSAVAACQADAQQLNTGLAAYYASNQSYPAATAGVGTTANTGAGFVSSFPTTAVTTGTTVLGLAPTFLQTLPDNPTHYKFQYLNSSGTYVLEVSAVPVATTPVYQVISTNDPTLTAVGASAACTLAPIS